MRYKWDRVKKKLNSLSEFNQITLSHTRRPQHQDQCVSVSVCLCVCINKHSVDTVVTTWEGVTVKVFLQPVAACIFSPAQRTYWIIGGLESNCQTRNTCCFSHSLGQLKFGDDIRQTHSNLNLLHMHWTAWAKLIVRRDVTFIQCRQNQHVSKERFLWMNPSVLAVLVKWVDLSLDDCGFASALSEK